MAHHPKPTKELEDHMNYQMKSRKKSIERTQQQCANIIGAPSVVTEIELTPLQKEQLSCGLNEEQFAKAIGAPYRASGPNAELHRLELALKDQTDLTFRTKHWSFYRGFVVGMLIGIILTALTGIIAYENTEVNKKLYPGANLGFWHN